MKIQSVFCLVIYYLLANSDCQADNLFNTDKPIILGHRGACGVYPEHTVLSYEKAAEFGADYIECDVQVTKVNDRNWTEICKSLQIVGTALRSEFSVGTFDKAAL